MWNSILLIISCLNVCLAFVLFQLLELDTSKDCASLNQSFELHYPMAGCVRALSAVESLIFAVIDDSLLCWDISSNLHNAQQISHCYESKVSCMAPFQAADGGCCWLVSADERGTLHSWDPSAIAQMGRVQAHCECINSLSSAGQLLFTASNDSTVALWKHVNE
ncbi:WD domain, G-beta repeat protein [Trichuris suis]|nr:WD domain, G-beta repeat protein [Trichuris suis]